MDIIISVAGEEHLQYAEEICREYEESAKVRGTGIAKRSPEYVIKKMLSGDAVIALEGDKFVGFCYIESFENKKYVSNSGLLVHPDYRSQGIAKKIKTRIFNLARDKYPEARIFGITTSLAVMKINSALGYHPVTFSELTKDETFWKGCSSCSNYNILTSKNYQMCLCTGMLAPSKVEAEAMKLDLSKRIIQPEKMSKPIVVLAYSGGLDTSYCIKYLTAEKDLAVHAALVDTGGFDPDEIKRIEELALSLGAEKFIHLNAVQRYYNACIRYLIYGNVLRNNTYPLSVSAERVFQALEIVEYANKIGATSVAHGSTGAGNDQVRFDLAFQVLGKELEIITPIRDKKLSRQQEVSYLKENGVNLSWEKAQYSINQGLWGTSVGGKETLTSHLPLPEEAYPSQLVDGIQPRTLTLTFKKGELRAIDDQNYKPLAAIQELSRIAREYAIGRDIHVGDTIIGIKGRVGFEAGGPLIIIKAHHLLEKHTLTKWQLYWKEQLANWYGMLLHEGQYLEPVMRNIEDFLEDTQKEVTGEVTVRLHPYRFELLGIKSANDLMQSRFGSYGEENKTWDSEDAKGFIKLLATPLKNYYSVHKPKKND